MLKLNCQPKQRRRLRDEFPIDLSKFGEHPRRIRRLKRKPDLPQRNAFRVRDERMDDDEEED